MSTYEIEIRRKLTFDADSPYEAVGRAIGDSLHLLEADIWIVREIVPQPPLSIALDPDLWQEALDPEGSGLGIPRARAEAGMLTE